ncbi:MAG: pentapeptide repeat-containing protein [Acidobacteria bacterium]|nr:pentapeptide repeat-containing protein [Acidobacteriota bacterium]
MRIALKPRRVCAVAVFLLSFSSLLWAQKPAVGPNVNMVSGTKWPAGDPFLTKQNEPSIAVSSMNPQHLLAGANDYRLVDLSQAVDIPGETGAGDAWIFLFTSVDGGASWRSRAMSGCPLNVAQCNNQLSAAIKGRQFAADPTVRPGPYGTFFLSFIAANRGTSTDGVVGVQRFFDKNNNVNVGDDPIVEDVVNILDTGTSGQFKDKPWVIADVGGRQWNGANTCTLPGFATPVPAFNVYVSYSNFVGNSGSNPHPQILVARSVDCGRTFEKPVKVSNSVDTNSGSVVTIDPQTGTIYVIWRRFGDPAAGTQDGIYVAKSTDGGSKFSNPSLISPFQAFDQGTSAYSFRTNALPSAAVSVGADGKSRVHVVWSQRKANGDARIAMSTSANAGNSWSTPQYIDDWSSDPINPANPGRGHQFQPTLTFAGGKLLAAWFDQRYDHTVGVLECPSGTNCTSILQFVERRKPVGALATGGVDTVFTQYLTDAGLTRRHTIDTFSAMADPSNQPVFQSSRVSQFLHGNVAVPPKGSKAIQQLRFNVPNVPIFVNNTRSFLGDYLDVAAQSIIPTGNAAQPYAFNTAATEKPVFHVTWTDNRDVVPPLKSTSSWQNTPGAVLVVNPDGSVTTAINPNCIPGFDGSKNQNIYTAKVGEGVAGFVQVNSKDLSSTLKRGFVVGVQNMLTTSQTFKLVIPSQPSGGNASFDQATTGVTNINVIVPARSSASRVVWVTAGSAKASLNVEIQDANGVLLKTLTLNPDPNATGAFLPNPAGDISNNDLSDSNVKNVELTNVELTNVELTNVELTNVELTNVELTNVELTNVELTNVELTNVELTNVELTNVELTNVELTNVELTNNSFQNVELTNGGMADATFTVTNRGNADTTLNIKTLLKNQEIPPGYKLQLAMRKISPSPSAQMTQAYLTRPAGQCKIAFVAQNIQNANIPTPRIENPDDGTLGQFLVSNGDANNPTLPLLAGEKAQITMRILGPTQSEANSFAQNALKLVAIGATGTITPIPLIIKTLSLPAGTALQPYSYLLKTFGGAGTIAFCPDPTKCVLPSWLSISSSGLLSGTPPVSGTFMLTVRVSDTGSVPPQSDVQNLVLVVNPATQTVAFTPGLPASLNYGDSLTLSVSASGSGAVTFAGSGSCTVSGTTLTTTGAGTCTVTATKAGDAVYASATQTGTINIQKGSQTITFGALSNQTYGALPVTVSATTSSGLAVTFSAAGSCSVSGSTVSILGAGSCTITANQAGDSNYNAAPAVPRTFSISPATLTVTADNLSRAYGAANPALTYTITGYQNGDTSSVVTGAPSCSTTAVVASPVGDYPISCTIGNLSAVNYTFTFSNGTLKVVPASQTITFGALSNQTYGALPFTLSASTSSGLPVTFTAAGTPAGACSVSGTTVTISAAGSCTVTANQAGDGNYNASPAVARTFSISPATLTVTVDNPSRVYGAVNPALTYVVSGYLNGDTAAVVTGAAACTTTAAAGSAVGAYPISCALGTLSAANYTFAFVGGSMTVTKALLTVTAASQQRYYGTPNPAFNAVITGFVNGETQATAGIGGTLIFTTPAVLLSDVGIYAVMPSGLTASNYAFTYGAGSLTVLIATPVFSNLSVPAVAPGAATANISGKLTWAGLAPPGSVAITLNGGVAQQAVIGADGSFSVSVPAGISTIGAYSVTFSYPGASPNYTAATASATLKVEGFLATGNMQRGRREHTATLMNNGRVLIAGGIDSSGTPSATVEVYDPANGTFHLVENMPNKAFGHTSTLLATGKVLIAGGGNSATELFDPVTETLSSGGGMSSTRSYHTATLLGSGKVLLTGGVDNGGKTLNSTLLYDPATASFASGPNMKSARERHTAVLLADGRVLIAGGRQKTGANYNSLSSAEIYDPALGTFAYTAAGMGFARHAHTAVLLTNGKVALAGGSNGIADLASAEVFDPAAGGTFTTTGNMATARSNHAGVALADGTPMVTGGKSGTAVAVTGTEFYSMGASTFLQGPSMLAARSSFTMTLLQNGNVLVTGGAGTTGSAVATAEVYTRVP